jgi:omega-amidase
VRARAIENQAYVVGVNRCGSDPQLAYPGGSMIVNPWGKTVVRVGQGEALISAMLDLKMLHQIRRDFPVLRDIWTRFVLKD